MDGGEAARRVVGYCSDAFWNKAAMINNNPIMMRFRPIAPKPVVVGGSTSGVASSVESSKNSLISKARTKRKYVRVRRYNRRKKTTRNTTGEFLDQTAVPTTTTTLQLLPERRVELELDLDLVGGGGSQSSELIAAEENEKVSDPNGRGVELWVTVECVRETCMGLELAQQDIGCTDEERIKNLESDTCPGFVSDGMNRVEWLNEAFKRMVRQKQNKAEKIGVWLITNPNPNPKLPNLSRGFTCQIKLHFKSGTQMEKDSKVVPCDAWRLDGGGFAWKLDVKAALTLAPSLHEDFL